MASSNVPDAEKSVSVSEELLRLLRSINEKLDSGGRLNEVEAVVSGKVSGPPQTSELFRWYENTLPGIDFAAAHIEMLCEFRPNTPFKYHHTPAVQQPSKLRAQMEYLSRNFLGWTRKYESPFNIYGNDRYQPPFVSQICNAAGKFWAIPRDGRIGLALDPHNDNYFKTMRSAPSKRLSQLKEFDELLRKRPGCGLAVADLDPWNGQFLIHEGPEDSTFKELGYLYWRISWEDRSWDVTATSGGRLEKKWFEVESGDRTFAPLLQDNREDLNNKAYAPWRRIILCRGLGSMPSNSIYKPDERHPCPYFAQNLPAALEFDISHDIALDLVREHCLCVRLPGNGSANPYIESRGFQLVFYEIINAEGDTKPPERTWWKTGELFNERAGTTGTFSAGALRRSAFSVRHPHTRKHR